MNLSVFLKLFRFKVNASTGKALSVNSLSKLIGVDQYKLQKWEQGKGNPKDESDRKSIKNFFGIEDFEEIKEEILNSAISRFPQPAYREQTEGQRIRQQKAIGTRYDDGLIYVPIAAQAGYTRYFKDPVFVSDLMRVYLPGLPYRGDDFRVFEVEGDSMEYYNDANQPTGISNGALLIAECIKPEYWQFIQQWYIHIIVTENRIMVKRLFKKDDNKTFVCISDNAEYKQFTIDISEIKELWVVKRKIDWHMPPPRQFEITV